MCTSSVLESSNWSITSRTTRAARRTATYIGYAGVFDQGGSERDPVTGHLRMQIGTLFRWGQLAESQTLVHEAGHISALMRGFDQESPEVLQAGLVTDNAFRTILGCPTVKTHEET